MAVTLVTGANAFDRLAGEWRELQGVAGGSPFQTYEWISTWAKHLGRSKRPVIATVREGQDLIGLYPLVKTRPWKGLRPAGTGPSDILGPLARPGQEERVSQDLVEWMRGQSLLLDLQQVRSNSLLASLLGDGIEQARCLLLDLPPTYDGYLGTLSKSLRYDCRRFEKEAFTKDGFRFEEVGPDRIDEGLDALFEVHRRRWRKRGLPGAFLGRVVPFQREWARLAAQNGWLWLTLLHSDQEVIGAIYAMRMGSTCYFYQAGFDPGSKAISPGTVLVAYTIRRAIQEGLTLFDFLRGDEPYKRRWKPQREVVNLRYLIPQGGILSHAGAQWNKAAFGVESQIRARLEGKGLIGS